MTEKTIEQVKAEWETRIMTIPGVWSVGIGLSKETGRACIKVSTSKEIKREQIPENIEGYQVEVVVRAAPRPL